MPRKKARAVSDNAGVESASAETSRATTQISTARRQRRWKAGSLKDMPNMPMDILLEIFSYLLPMDLLNLARTSKPFRVLLMSRISAGLWRTSRKLVEGLPDCPEHLSEPAYANLVFSAQCHNCLKPNTQSILWELLVRYCRPCKKLLTVKLFDDTPHAKFVYERFDVMWYLVNKAPVHTRCLYHIPQIEQVQKAWHELHDDAEKWSHYEREQRQRVDAIQDHAAACAQWALDVANAKEEQLEQVRDRRLQFVVSKLRGMGWGDEIDRLPDDLSPLSSHSHVHLAREISERSWEKIRDELSAYMGDIKQHRLARQRSIILHIRLKTLDSIIRELRNRLGRDESTECLPKFADFALMPEFRELMEAPTEDMLDMEAFVSLVIKLCDLEARWIMEQEKRLVGMLERALGRVPEEPDGDHGAKDDSEDASHQELLKLAWAVFECRQCSERLHASCAIAHRCTRYNGVHWSFDLDSDETVGNYMYEVRRISHYVRPWNISCFFVPELEPLWSALQTCGKDPETTTALEMDEQDDVRFAIKGRLIDGKRKVLSWMGVMRAGHLDPDVCETGWQFDLVSDEDIRKAKALESERDEEIAEELLGDKAKFWCCGLCDEAAHGRTRSVILDHVGEKHDKWDYYDAADSIYMHPDTVALVARRPVFLPPP
ncbi:hypothetical protein DAEQUDRAFT_707622 [Daedalea quercina L-15889]|uniref:F-box domain-containing protein n=1 Tax=Daedalea quercina L-15889 TaxID=1314783 RepID=A0A165RL58_9APHY|nr:hypothetical protein DAEQUDRAFT_707622 [Daedalea quercina L-15889]